MFRRAILVLLAACACSTERAPTTDAGPAMSPDAHVTLAADAEGRDVGSTSCSFNDDCDPSERCACANQSCACAVGPRGTGISGVTACTSGADCASALCLEGPGDALICSGPCAESAECPAALPRCLTVPTIGSFCARAPASDAGTTLDDAGVSGCTGACASTDLSAMIDGRSGIFVRAQHGRTASGGIRIEAHFGGDPACPGPSSPTPDRTLVIVGLTSVAGAQTEADGVRATLFDFRGDITSAPLLRATAARVTSRFIEDAIAVSFDLDLTFPGGSIRGGVYAPHCASLDD